MKRHSLAKYLGSVILVSSLLCACGSEEFVQDESFAEQMQTAQTEGPAPTTDAPAPLVDAAAEAPPMKPEDQTPAEFATVLPGTPLEPVAEAAPVKQETVAENTVAPKAEESKMTAEDEVAAKELESVIADNSDLSEKLPAPPERPVRLGDAQLNRYYFLRIGDTPESAALLLLGSAQKAGDLVAWNQGIGKWAPGKMVLYRSVNGTFENDMMSFYQEKNLQSQQYVVRKGETLSDIAQKTYGDHSTWKEIAMLNGIQTPNRLEPGQKLMLYPAEIPRTTTAETTVAAAPVETKALRVEEVDVGFKAELAEEKAPAAPSPAAVVKAPPQLASTDGIGSFASKHFLLIIVAAGLIGGAAYFINRRRQLRDNLWR